ncbi:hypothetical protein TNCV_3436861 [Trichonephila clavipes]|nr:hypothetical protein TNCV_3436861 [Trichonephila clavipes]
MSFWTSRTVFGGTVKKYMSMPVVSTAQSFAHAQRHRNFVLPGEKENGHHTPLKYEGNYRAVPSRAPSQELVSFASQVSARMFAAAWTPKLLLPLKSSIADEGCFLLLLQVKNESKSEV